MRFESVKEVFRKLREGLEDTGELIFMPQKFLINDKDILISLAEKKCLK